MKSLRWALIGLGLLGLLTAASVFALIINSDAVEDPAGWAVASSVIGLSFIGTGLFAWWRRPASRFGALMAAVGFTWFLQALSGVDPPLLATIGGAFSALWLAVLCQMLLSFPTGRLQSRLERRTVGALYAMAGVLVPLAALFDSELCTDCEPAPRNVLLVADSPTLVTVVDVATTVVGVAISFFIAAVLVRRWRSASRVARRGLAPVFVAGAAAMAWLSVLLFTDTAGVSGTLIDIVPSFALLAFTALPYAFLAGLLRSRYARAGAVSDLVGRLGAAGGPGNLRAALSEGLGDPTLRIAYYLPERDHYVDSEGRPVELPQPGSGKAVTDIERDGQRVAAIVHDDALAEDQELVQAAGAAASLALDNERLDAELKARIEELQASRARLVEAGDAERRRLERNLHDGAQQRLVAISITLGLARTRAESDPAATRSLLDGASAELDQALAELRELARGIHPAVLADHGLDAALESLAGRAGLPVDVLQTPPQRLPAPVEVAAYYVIAEALTNVAKYARADSATVAVRRDNGKAVIEVRDNGVGGADPASGSGLRGLEDRVAALDGRLGIESPPGEGTLVRAVIPCA